MKKIILFTEEESNIIEKLLGVLKKKGNFHEIKNIMNNQVALEGIAKSISLYPSIMMEQHLGHATRSIETLIDSLCQNEELDIILHIPTKALLGNGFSIAKINFFFMLFYISREMSELEQICESIKDIASNNIFTLMAEELFLSIIEDREISKSIRMEAGYLIANIWEYRLDHGVKEFPPVLSNIWKARETLIPAYGTMLGFSEFFRIFKHTESVFLEFLQRDNLSEEEIASIEEFIFGLSYEEIIKIRSAMENSNKGVISREEIEKIIGQKTAYPEYKIDDPRELYRSFKHRIINAKYRARAKIKGPYKTIEEYIMCYLLARAN